MKRYQEKEWHTTVKADFSSPFNTVKVVLTVTYGSIYLNAYCACSAESEYAQSLDYKTQWVCNTFLSSYSHALMTEQKPTKYRILSHTD